MHKPSDYLAIQVWGQQLGSFPYYIDAEQRKAAKAGAPLDAVYEKWDYSGGTGTWVTVRDLKPDHPFRVSYEASAHYDLWRHTWEA